MRKLWTVVALILNVVLFGSAANPAKDFVYKLNDAGDGVVITGYIGKKGGKVVIPEKIEGMPVVRFECGPLDGWSEGLMYFSKDIIKRNKKNGTYRPPITEVVFPDTMTEIAGKNGVFESCESLRSVTLPKKVRYMSGLFSNNNPKLTKIKMPEEAQVIGASMFSGCVNLTSIVLPRGLETIGEYAFSGCKSLKSIVIPKGTVRIEDGAFQYCESATSLKLPDSIEYIGSYAFRGCGALAKVDILAKQIEYGGYSTPSAFEGCLKLGLSEQKKIKASGYTGDFKGLFGVL
ncbi:leucine rich repeats superfamily protein [Candidatus Termititenax aidoneus]|uniref:Leucine rich repeats superfamily protein n=1 Tax=Termititenax aidoneus TaxID=2218524 RepID=A0A388TBT2_TERA1|nr:leucine rich repeats superfamily protein [Candidatus Termititenax aidoneus]